ncbi:energy transducer TonB [Algoriphagus terrigena]|uniref:energy transducer TonB n=1 Tax=Algoriphagus terrigena TaxID=344884 RepID=UPI0004177AF1|nr:energy transducer TonB [Algoriphagus terrigena]
MELKKNIGSDLRRWQGPLLNLGLMISVGAVLVAFEWKAEEENPLLDISKGTTEWDTEIVPITIQNPPPVTPPPVSPPEIKIIDNDIKVDQVFTIDINPNEAEIIPPVELAGPPTVEVADEILDFSEVPAEFAGGMDAWYKYLRGNLNYPRQAQRMGIDGTVLVRFVVNTDGGIQDVEVVRQVDPALDKAAMDAVLNSPNWKAARHHGKPVRVRMTIPIKFKLN